MSVNEITSEFLNQILKKLLKRTFDWDDAKNLLQFHSDDNWDAFFNAVFREITLPKKYKKSHKDSQFLKVYIPGTDFPSISLTGNACALNCEHCDRKYLTSMIPASTPSQLIEVLNNLNNGGKVGTLLSGGCNSEGKVDYSKFIQVIRDFKRSEAGKNFFLNSHVGLLTDSEVEKLAEIGIDAVSFDLNLDSEVIHDIFHLQHQPDDYQQTYETLLEYGIQVIPHILIGANFGKIKEELKALQYLRTFEPKVIVFIVMIPPRIQGVIDPRFSLVAPEDVAKLIVISSYFFPDTELSLGCMRPYWNDAFHTEKWAVQAGVLRLVKPTMKTRQWLENESIHIQKLSACCVIPPEFEKLAKKN